MRSHRHITGKCPRRPFPPSLPLPARSVHWFAGPTSEEAAFGLQFCSAAQRGKPCSDLRKRATLDKRIHCGNLLALDLLWTINSFSYINICVF